MALDVTSSWEDTVLIIAASKAESKNPVMSGWNNTFENTIKIVSGSLSAVPVSWTYATPISPTSSAPITEMIIQPIAMRRAGFSSFTDEIAIKRTIICG